MDARIGSLGSTEDLQAGHAQKWNAGKPGTLRNGTEPEVELMHNMDVDAGYVLENWW